MKVRTRPVWNSCVMAVGQHLLCSKLLQIWCEVILPRHNAKSEITEHYFYCTLSIYEPKMKTHHCHSITDHHFWRRHDCQVGDVDQQVADSHHGNGDDDGQGQVPSRVDDLFCHVILQKNVATNVRTKRFTYKLKLKFWKSKNVLNTFLISFFCCD